MLPGASVLHPSSVWLMVQTESQTKVWVRLYQSIGSCPEHFSYPASSVAFTPDSSSSSISWFNPYEMWRQKFVIYLKLCSILCGIVWWGAMLQFCAVALVGQCSQQTGPIGIKLRSVPRQQKEKDTCPPHQLTENMWLPAEPCTEIIWRREEWYLFSFPSHQE